MKNRHSIRLKNYDYSLNGAYFVTICTHDREYLFGDIVNKKMVLNQYGQITNRIINSLTKRFPADIDIYQIMPNHIQQRSLLSQIIGFLKMNSSKSIHQINPNFPIWQRNYFEHIIRNEIELSKIREYIVLNPRMWERDRNNPENLYV